METKILEPIILEDFYANRDIRVYDKYEPSIRAEREGLKAVEPIIYDDYNGQIKADQSAVGTLTTNCGNDAPRNGTKIIFQSENVTADSKPNEYDVVEVDGKAYIYIQGDWCRIRKLTPLECWRLMDFDDADFEKAEKVNSNVQLYKQAGNSIVVSVLEAIIGEMV